MRLRPLRPEDGERLSAAFAAIGWSKPVSTFERYAEEQQRGGRWLAVAELPDALAGYVTVAWAARDPVFRAAGIPEIEDLNVLPAFRGRGIGTCLMDAAEAEIRRRADTAGLRVGLHSGYGPARLRPARLSARRRLRRDRRKGRGGGRGDRAG